MQNIIKNNQIFLSGGGNEKQSFPLDTFFFRTLPKNGCFLYIPVALRGHKIYPKVNFWMKKILHLHQRNDLHFKIANNLLNYKHDINSFDAVYIGGGNTWNLMQELKDSYFSNTIIKYFQNGGSLYGGSAGAIILGKKINTHDNNNKINIKDIEGLKLLSDYSVACHFKNKNNHIFKKWALYNKSPIICLPEETGLIIQNNSALCTGTQNTIIYNANGRKIEIQPGKYFEL
jgi:dipeptidase E